MKRKTRKIIVNGIEYNYLIRFDQDGDGGLNLIVFGVKTNDGFNKWYSGHEIITPKIVEEAINEHYKNDRSPVQ